MNNKIEQYVQKLIQMYVEMYSMTKYHPKSMIGYIEYSKNLTKFLLEIRSEFKNVWGKD